MKGRQSKYPKSRTDDMFQLSKSCNRKDTVGQAPPKFQSNLNPLRCQKLLAREAFVSPVLNQYHSQYSIFVVSPETDIPTSQPYVPRRFLACEVFAAPFVNQYHAVNIQFWLWVQRLILQQDDLISFDNWD